MERWYWIPPPGPRHAASLQRAWDDEIPADEAAPGRRLLPRSVPLANLRERERSGMSRLRQIAGSAFYSSGFADEVIHRSISL